MKSKNVDNKSQEKHKNGIFKENEKSKKQGTKDFSELFEELKKFSKKYGLEDVDFLKDLEFFDGQITFVEGSAQERFVDISSDLQLNDFYRYVNVFCVIAENMGMLDGMYRHSLKVCDDDVKTKILEKIGSNSKIKKEDLKNLANLLKSLYEILSKEKGFRYNFLKESGEIVPPDYEKLYFKLVSLSTVCCSLSKFFESCLGKKQIDISSNIIGVDINDNK